MKIEVTLPAPIIREIMHMQDDSTLPITPEVIAAEILISFIEDCQEDPRLRTAMIQRAHMA